METAEAGERGEPPGLGRRRSPRFRRSEVTTATREMAGGGDWKEDDSGVRDPLLVYVLALPATALPVVVSRLDAAVPRKARSRLPRPVPSAWWSYRIPVLPPSPPPAKDRAEEEGRRFARPQRVRVAPSPDLAEAAAAKKPAKRARRCLHCDVAETPQWRSGPMGRRTLCNACGVRYRSAWALRERRPSGSSIASPPPGSPIAESPPESPIWEPGGGVPPAIYLVKKPTKRGRTPRTEAAAAPGPGTKSCLHCGSSATPQWREGPMGRGTLCNACGVRYRQGRLLPEYRPIASPTFVPSEHANNHRRVLQLRQHRQSNDQHPPRGGINPSTVSDDHPIDAPGYTGGNQVDAPGFGDDNTHRLVFKLRRHRQSKNKHDKHLAPRPPTVDSVVNLSIAGDHPTDAPGVAGNHPTEAPSCADDNLTDAPGCGDNLIDAPSSLDSLLLDGPSAPLIVDSDDFLIS